MYAGRPSAASPSPIRLTLSPVEPRGTIEPFIEWILLAAFATSPRSRQWRETAIVKWMRLTGLLRGRVAGGRCGYGGGFRNRACVAFLLRLLFVSPNFLFEGVLQLVGRPFEFGDRFSERPA